MARVNRNLVKDRLQALGISLGVGLLRLLPFTARRRFAAWLGRNAVLRIGTLRQRISNNIDYVWPALDSAQRHDLMAQVGAGFGQTMIEIYSAADLLKRHNNFLVTGAGLDALLAARATGKGAILVSGHFGQWEAIRIALWQRGMEVGAVYRPNNNSYYDAGFLRAIRQMGQPILPNTAAGTRAIIRHVSKGGMIALLIDQHIRATPALNFFGKPAPTATFAADLALKYDLPLVACYGIRRPQSPVIDVVLEAPVPHSDALAMTQQLNDSLEARVRANPGQWHWLHQRWRKKPI